MKQTVEYLVDSKIICPPCKGTGGANYGCCKCDGRGWVNSQELVQKQVDGTTVKNFAVELNKSPGALLAQLKLAGCEKLGLKDVVTDSERRLLLNFLMDKS